MGRPASAPIYILPYGIQVIGEYPPKGKNPYWRVRIRPHCFFSCTERYGGLCVRRSRVVMASVLGRALLVAEHVHHKNENRADDRPENLELITAAEHNQHHHIGLRHSRATKRKIAATLREAYASGRKKPANGATKRKAATLATA